MISDIKTAAESVGITAVITKSTENIETQLNKLTKVEDYPLMLVSWDLDYTLSFDSNGFLNNPSIKVVVLLMSKAEGIEKELMEETAEEMGLKFQEFASALYSQLVQYQRVGDSPLSDIGYKLTPMYGAGKHSGIVGRFTMSSGIKNC